MKKIRKILKINFSHWKNFLFRLKDPLIHSKFQENLLNEIKNKFKENYKF